MRKTILTLAVLATTVAACDRSRTDEIKTVAELQTISAQKDSLLRDVTETTAFLADISRQISSVRNLKTSYGAQGASDLEDNLTPDQRRERVRAQVQEITERLNSAEGRLATSRRRVAELSGSDKEKTERLAMFDSTVASYKDIIENQKSQLAGITEQLNALTTENTKLKTDNVQLVSEKMEVTSQRDSLQVDRNTVYYIVADAKTLEEHNVIEKVGGFLGLGATRVPAASLDEKEFVPIDMTTVNEIPLPKADKSYKIITRQNLSALESPVEKGGIVKGTLKIRDPEAFWKNSQFLILVER
jgi:predicted  nucleic acid-binding Zn-ribbon protein